MVKQVKHYSEIRDKIENAIRTIADPVRGTMGPRGGNVIFEDHNGIVTVTNDGVTIAKNIAVKDPFEDAIIQIIREASLKTNTQAGDGTSTTILLSSILAREGLKLVDMGVNQRDVEEAFRSFEKSIIKQLNKLKKDIKTDEDLFAITKIASNNDSEIAKNAVRVVRTAGEDGWIFFEPGTTKETDIKEDTGFIIEQGLLDPRLTNNNIGTANYGEVPVLITDKQIYYSQEAETILNTVLQNGYREVIIVAKDFVGEAPGFFITNHLKGVIKVMLVKDPNVDKTNGATLEDLACYLNGHVISEKQGNIVDSLTIEDFCMAQKVYADSAQTVIVRYAEDNSTRLDGRVKLLKKDLRKFGDEDSLEKKTAKKRLASLTNGVVTIHIGGSTPLEVKERRFRYEDAIGAGRAAVMDGFLLGGGISMLNAYFSRKDKLNSEYEKIFEKVCKANLFQIAENAGETPELIIQEVLRRPTGTGYNALTREYVQMEKEGILDPYRVTIKSIENAVSIANSIIGSRYIIIEDNESTEKGEGK